MEGWYGLHGKIARFYDLCKVLAFRLRIAYASAFLNMTKLPTYKESRPAPRTEVRNGI